MKNNEGAACGSPFSFDARGGKLREKGTVMADIRWGILGAARFARQHMGPAIHAAHGSTLAALATSSPEKAASFQAFAPELRVHDSYDALLADPDIDAVYIPLPNTLHAPWAEKAMRAGKSALVEKPIAMSVADIDRLIAVSAETGCLCAEAFMPAHHPQWAQVRALLAEGAVGKLEMIRGIFTFTLEDAANIRAQAGMGGGGLRDVGIYPIGAARLAMGAEPSGITAHIRMENGVDTLAELRGMFGDVVFTCISGLSQMRHQEMVFHGAHGMIRLQAPFNPGVFAEGRIDLLRPDHSVQTWRYPDVRQYVLQVEAFCASVRSRQSYPVPLSFSRGSQMVIDAAFAAAS
ncbi:MAG: putative dehydrogenase [Sulfitobacter sp.]